MRTQVLALQARASQAMASTHHAHMQVLELEARANAELRRGLVA